MAPLGIGFSRVSGHYHSRRRHCLFLQLALDARLDQIIEKIIAAMRAALIPITNSLLAVGLVSLPGMMTGQILSGVSPFIAARYQIMVMCMISGAAGLSAALFLTIARKELEREP